LVTSQFGALLTANKNKTQHFKWCF